MRINEVISPLKKFIATVSVKGTQAKTMINAESQSQARLLLGKQYGEKNVISVSHINLDEQQTVTATPKPSKQPKKQQVTAKSPKHTKQQTALPQTQKPQVLPKVCQTAPNTFH